MKKLSKAQLVEKAATELAWGQSVDQVAQELEVPREELQKWMRRESFRTVWKHRFEEFVRYLQGPSVALLAEQLCGTDEKIRAAAAASIIKLGDQLGAETDSSLRVHFAMPTPGEPDRNQEE